jgi:phospholipid/cholesterol/gamma-HCH transport system permease protein
VSAGPAIEERGEARALIFDRRLDTAAAGPAWNAAMRAAGRAKGRTLILDLSAVTHCDTAGATLLLALERAHDGETRVEGAAEPVAALLARVRPAAAPPAPVPPAKPPTLGEVLRAMVASVAGPLAYVGEAFLAFLRLPARLRLLRPGDLLRYADQAGVRAMPLVLMLGFLIGMILAFQSAIPMRTFGADIFVANLVTISLLRELGPLLAAVILSGRTGSAFAAEIGTMKVNEEIDALRTMDLDPMTMLVIPRLIAIVAVMPALTLAMEIAGIAGMTVVMMGFGYPLAAVRLQVANAATTTDLFGGLFKAVCFGAAIAAIACRAGLATGVGPRAVGLSATAAVVGGIVASILLDGVFALLFYRLGL